MFNLTQGKRVKNIRKTLGLTLENFGKRVGVTKQTISRIENGINNLTEQMILAISREFNVNEEWLRNGTGEMFNEPKDELANILSNIIENSESGFYQMILQLAHAYAELSPESQLVVDEYTKKLLENLKRPN